MTAEQMCFFARQKRGRTLTKRRADTRMVQPMVDRRFLSGKPSKATARSMVINAGADPYITCLLGSMDRLIFFCFKFKWSCFLSDLLGGGCAYPYRLQDCRCACMQAKSSLEQTKTDCVTGSEGKMLPSPGCPGESSDCMDCIASFPA